MTNNKFLFGSKMLKLNNPRDEDILEFVDVPRGTTLNQNQRRVEFSQAIIKTFKEGKNEKTDAYKALFLYQLSNGFHPESNYPMKDFNILDYKDIWAKHLKNYMNLETTILSGTKRDHLSKRFYHILYQYFMIKENTHWISEEGKALVQQIHDYDMPVSYFYELKEMINSL